MTDLAVPSNSLTALLVDDLDKQASILFPSCVTPFAGHLNGSI
jgi:hypothetical protein